MDEEQEADVTLKEVWLHLNPGVPFDEWVPPYWFTWPNDLTPERVDQHVELADELTKQREPVWVPAKVGDA